MIRYLLKIILTIYIIPNKMPIWNVPFFAKYPNPNTAFFPLERIRKIIFCVLQQKFLIYTKVYINRNLKDKIYWYFPHTKEN